MKTSVFTHLEVEGPALERPSGQTPGEGFPLLPRMDLHSPKEFEASNLCSQSALGSGDLCFVLAAVPVGQMVW